MKVRSVEVIQNVVSISERLKRVRRYSSSQADACLVEVYVREGVQGYMGAMLCE